jgi:uncharacterized membrane protein
MTLDARIDSARLALKVGLGLAAFLAGLDKFFDLLAVWPKYLSPAAAALLPVSPATAMHVVGVIEMAVGLALLGPRTRMASWVAGAWLLAIAANLVAAGGFLDVAVRDVVMAIAAFALARLTEAHEAATAAAPGRPAARSAA